MKNLNPWTAIIVVGYNIYAIVIVDIILGIFKTLALNVPSLSCQISNPSLSRWLYEESRIMIFISCTRRDKLLSKKQNFQTAWSLWRTFFLALYILKTTDLREQISHLYLSFKIVIFNDKKVMEVSCII